MAPKSHYFGFDSLTWASIGVGSISILHTYRILRNEQVADQDQIPKKGDFEIIKSERNLHRNKNGILQSYKHIPIYRVCNLFTT